MPAGVEIASMFARIGADTRGLEKGLSRAEGRIKSTGQKMGRLGSTLTTAVTLPLLGLAAGVLKVGADFEEGMALLKIAMGRSGESMQDVSDFALKMGADTIFGANEMIEGMTGFAKAGLTAEEIMGDMTGKTGALRAASDLATASSLTLAQATDAVTIAMATFGLEVDQVDEIANSFVQAADASVTEVNELAAAMVNIGPVAASMGLSLEDTNTLLAILSEGGLKGADAGTALRSMFANLSRTTPEVVKALAALNIELFDAEGNLRELPDILGQFNQALFGQNEALMQVGGRTAAQNDELERLHRIQRTLQRDISDFTSGIKGVTLSEDKRSKKLAELNARLENTNVQARKLEDIQGRSVKTLEKLTEQERLEAIQTIAGERGKVALNLLLDKTNSRWSDMTKAISEAATVQQIADVRANTLKGKLEELGGSVETVAIKLASVLAPRVKKFVDESLIPWIDKIAELDEDQLNLALNIAGFALVAGPGLKVIGGLAALFTGAGAPIAGLIASIGLLALAYETDFLGIKKVLDGFEEQNARLEAGFTTAEPIPLTFKEKFKEELDGTLANFRIFRDEFNAMEDPFFEIIALGNPEVKASLTEALNDVEKFVKDIPKFIRQIPGHWKFLVTDPVARLTDKLIKKLNELGKRFEAIKRLLSGGLGGGLGGGGGGGGGGGDEGGVTTQGVGKDILFDLPTGPVAVGQRATITVLPVFVTDMREFTSLNRDIDYRRFTDQVIRGRLG